MIDQISKDLGINLPKDLTPAERAKLKLYWHVTMIALVNAFLSAIVLLTQGKAISWRDVLLVLGGQTALAIIDAVKKYVTASGDVSFSALLSLAQVSLSKNVPSVALPAPAQQIEQAVTQMLNVPPVNSNPASASVQFQPAPSGFMPAPVQQPAPVEHPPIDNSSTVNTLPEIPAIIIKQG